MTTYTFGTGQNPAHYIEAPDGANNPPLRPTTTGTLKVRNQATQAALPDSTYQALTGYFSFTTTDVPIVEVSADGGTTWVPLIAIEAEKAGAAAGTTADLALSKAQQALDQIAAGGGGGGVGTVTKVAGISPDVTGNVPLNAGNVGARAVGVSIPTSEITGLSTVATTGLYSSLTGTPAASVPLSFVGAPNGVAGLDGTSKVPVSQLPGTVSGGFKEVVWTGTAWPSRTTVTSDMTVGVIYRGPLSAIGSLSIDTAGGTDANKMQPLDLLVVTA